MGMTFLLLAVAAGQVRVSFDDKILAKAPEEVTIANVAFSADGRHVVYVARRGTKMIVGIDQKVVGEYDAITSGPYIGADGKVVAWVARQGKSVQAIVGGKTVGTEGGISRIAISPDGKKWAYAASIGEKAYMNVNGKRSQIFAMVGPPVFAPKGSLVAFQANTMAGTDGITNRTAHRSRMVIGTKKGPHFERVGGDPVFSPDGKKVAYRAQTERNWFVVVNGAKGQAFDQVDALTWSPDGKHLLHRGQDGTKWHMVKDGARGEAYDELGPPVYGPKGKQLAYSVKKEGRGFILLDGREVIGEGTRWDSAADPVFSGNGKVLAYRARKQGKWRVITGDVPGAEFETVGEPLLNDDGSIVVYRATFRQYQFYVINEAQQTRFSKVRNAVIGPRGEVAYISEDQRGVSKVVCGYKSGPECDRIYAGPHFSRDGKKVAYGAKRGQDLVWMVLDLADKPVKYPPRPTKAAPR